MRACRAGMRTQAASLTEPARYGHSAGHVRVCAWPQGAHSQPEVTSQTSWCVRRQNLSFCSMCMATTLLLNVLPLQATAMTSLLGPHV